MAADDGDFPFELSPNEERLLIRLVTDAETRDPAAGAIDALPARSDFAPDASIDDGFAPTAAEEDAAAESANPFTATPLRSTRSQIRPPNLKRASECLEDASMEEQSAPVRGDFEDEFDDHRSPLQRFRSFPRRPLTVSDLTSGAWCELQYWYTLSRLPGGRRTRTAAMKQGSALHQKLEDEVHTTVEVEVLSREDGFGVRLWNLIQGLRTLRGTGLTRELEIWGVVDGNLVNGVIDYLSFQNPNPEFELELELSQEEAQEEAKQAKVTDYFASTKPTKERTPEGPKVYIADVKTRGSSRKVPDSVLRPAKIQLLLYHRFLADLAAGRLDFYKVFRRYGLDPDEPFSDTFLAQMAGSHDEMLDASPSSSWQSSDGGYIPYRSLRELLPLVEREVGITFPAGLASVGPMLRIEYVHRGDGVVIGHHDFAASRSALDGYLGAYMAWWRGERRAAGVSLDEAFKCRSCEFADTCTWRAAMDAKRVQSVRERLRAAGSSKAAT